MLVSCIRYFLTRCVDGVLHWGILVGHGLNLWINMLLWHILLTRSPRKLSMWPWTFFFSQAMSRNVKTLGNQRLFYSVCQLSSEMETTILLLGILTWRYFQIEHLFTLVICATESTRWVQATVKEVFSKVGDIYIFSPFDQTLAI